MPKRSFGYLPDPDGIYNGFHLHPASKFSLDTLPKEASIDDSAPPIWNQWITNSCVGHGFGGAIATTAKSNKLRLDIPSPGFLYKLARTVDRVPNQDGTLPRLQDGGARPNQLVRALGEWGIPAAVELKEKEATDPEYTTQLANHINDEPTLTQLLIASKRKLKGFNAIYSLGDLKVFEICESIAARYAVMGAVPAGNDAFQNFTRGVLDPTGTIPDHWIYYTAFRTVNGEKQFLMRNSWGLTDWGEDGKAWCSEAFVKMSLFNVLVARFV